VVRRQRFAEYVRGELARLARFDEWRDFRFTELEAEVEADGRRRFDVKPLALLRGGQSGLRREKSLSFAIMSTSDKIVLLEGAPGSGKSIALRHVAERMARDAARSKHERSLLPVYVNLKELERNADEAVGPNLVERFVLESLNELGVTLGGHS